MKNTRTEAAIIKAAKLAGFEVDVHGDDSRYIVLSCADADYGHNFGFAVRVSDHAQAGGGGFNQSRGERHGESRYSVSPTEMTLAQVVAEIEAEGAYVAREIEEARYEEIVCGF